MKVIVDMCGGDYPSEIVKGAAMASLTDTGVCPVLCGNEETARSILANTGHDPARIFFIDAKDEITNNDSPVEAVRSKKESSLVKGLYSLKDKPEEYGAFVSAGSTGAVLTGSLLIAGRIPGVDRPALTAILPNLKNGKTLLLDCGANVDSKPDYLLQFAKMGSVFMQTVYGIKSPRIALLSVGTEDKKGNELSKAAFSLIKNTSLNFIGNIEARELLSGDYDVVVTDGFAGNIALKSFEGAQKAIFSALKEEINKSVLSKLGALLMKKSFSGLRSRLDYTKQGGAVFLGCRQIVVKTHGSSKAETVLCAILQAADLKNKNLVDMISGALKEGSEDAQV